MRDRIRLALASVVLATGLAVVPAGATEAAWYNCITYTTSRDELGWIYQSVKAKMTGKFCGTYEIRATTTCRFVTSIGAQTTTSRGNWKGSVGGESTARCSILDVMGQIKVEIRGAG